MILLSQTSGRDKSQKIKLSGKGPDEVSTCCAPQIFEFSMKIFTIFKKIILFFEDFFKDPENLKFPDFLFLKIKNIG